MITWSPWWSTVLTIFVIGIASLGMPMVIFLLRENIKEIRQGIITDLARFLESGKTGRPNNNERRIEAHRIIPSFEFVKYKYFLARPGQPSANVKSRIGEQRDLAPWKFMLSMVPFAVVVFTFSCLTLSFYLTETKPAVVIENLFGKVGDYDADDADSSGQAATQPDVGKPKAGDDDDDQPPSWLRADDLAFLIITAFFGSYIASIRRFLRAVSNFDLGPLTFLRAADQMITATAVTAILFLSFPSSEFLGKFMPDAMSKVLGTEEESWLRSTFMPWLAVAFVIGMIPDIGLMNMYDHVKLRHLKRHHRNILDQVSIVSLEVLDGIDANVRARLEDLGIYDVQNLATANPIMLFVESPFGVYQSIDWVAQAQLCTAVGPESFIKLRKIQIRTIFDFEVAILGSLRYDRDQEPHLTSARSTPALRQAVFALLLDDPVINKILRGGADNLDDESLIAVGKIILDELYIHRLRQIWIIIQEKLGARFGLPGDYEESGPPDTNSGSGSGSEDIEMRIEPLKSTLGRTAVS